MTPGPDFTATALGSTALGVFLVAYGFVIAEEFTQLRKSNAVVVVAGVIWIIVGMAYAWAGQPGAETLLQEDLEGYGELLLFLLSAMTYVNTLQERNIFNALRDWLISRRFTLRTLFWITGGLAFFISPVLDNLTTALVMGAVVMAVGVGHPRFVMLACANIVVAANAGGTFSPFGDITTLMVWQAGVLDFWEFLPLFVPAAVNWLVPALCMSLAMPAASPATTGVHTRGEARRIHGAGAVCPDRGHDGGYPQLPAPAAGAGHDDGPWAARHLRLHHPPA